MGVQVDERARDEEHYLRWIFDPRHIIKDEFKPSFISLRRDEQGISGQIYERLETEEEIYKSAKTFERTKESYWGYAMATVGELKAVALDSDEIYVLMTESIVPAHAEIRFVIEGAAVVVNTPNSRLSYYFNEIKELLSRGISKHRI